MILYKREKDWYDYWRFNLFFPWAGKQERRNYHSFDCVEEGAEYGFKLPTQCILAYEKDIFWEFRLRLLGFGFGVTRQWSY